MSGNEIGLSVHQRGGSLSIFLRFWMSGLRLRKFVPTLMDGQFEDRIQQFVLNIITRHNASNNITDVMQLDADLLINHLYQYYLYDL